VPAFSSQHGVSNLELMSSSMIPRKKNKHRRLVLTSPRKLCLYDHASCDRSARYLASIVRTAVEGRHITVDLTLLDTYTAAAGLLLFANITAAQLITEKPDVVEVIQPHNRATRRMIVDTGLFQACRPGGSDRIDRLWSSKSLFLSGTDPAVDYQRTIEAIERTLHTAASDSVCRALNEAILNVSHHAYEFLDPQDPFKKLGKRWWQSFWVGESGLSMLMYDMGMGIPRTLEPPIFGTSHAVLLGRAMTQGISRLADTGRGQGSVDIKRPVVTSEFSSLFMLSNKGRLEFNIRRQIDQTSLLTEDVRGTYIEWHNESPKRT
jgi:hypothetical protein